jgi:hypothetical protein
VVDEGDFRAHFPETGVGQKPLRRLGVAPVGEIEVKRRTTFVDRPV